MKVTIKDYRLSACVTPLTIIRFEFLLTTKRNIREFFKFFEFKLFNFGRRLNSPKKVGRQPDEKSVSSRRSILLRK